MRASIKTTPLQAIPLLCALAFGLVLLAGCPPKPSPPHKRAAHYQQPKGAKRVRVLIRFPIPGGKGPGPAATYVPYNPQEILRYQTLVLKTLDLAQIHPTVTGRFTSIPWLGLEVDAAIVSALPSTIGIAGIVIKREEIFAPADDSNTQIGAAQLRAANSFDGTGTTVVVIDTGADSNHVALQNKVIEEACFSAPDTTGVSPCPNAAGTAQSTGPGTGAPCVSATPNSSPCKHGNQVAAIAVGLNLMPTFSGVATGAKLASIQICGWREVEQDDGTLLTELVANEGDLLLALQYVHEVLQPRLKDSFPIAAVNVSLASGDFSDEAACARQDSDLVDAIALLKGDSIAVVAASGDWYSKTSMGSPACVSDAVSVGSVTDEDKVLLYSCSASFLDLLAPGTVWSADGTASSYTLASGTSFAAPQVAAAFAILKQQSPSATPDDLLALLKEGGRPIEDPCNSVTTPRVCLPKSVLGSDCPQTGTAPKAVCN